jgi:type VII secretion protein EccB
MASRRDQAQAYFFVIGRLVAGLLSGDPDTLQRPNRRPSVGTVFGILIAVLIAAGFGIYGLLRPGGTSAWKNEPGSMVLVKETGARYLLVNGQLRPVLNYTSARLVLGGSAGVNMVSRDSLEGVPVGSPIGIPGAPDGLPSASKLYGGPWTVCVRPATGGSGVRTTLMLAADNAPALSDRQALLVSTPDSATFLIWQGKRHRVASAAVQVALGYGRMTPVPVSAPWINPVPSGPDLTFPAVAGRGLPGPALGGRPGVVGQVYEYRNPALGVPDLFLLRPDGLALLSQTQAALLLADPAAREAYGNSSVRPVPVSAEEVAKAGVRDRSTFVTGYPPSPPEAANDVTGFYPCVRHTIGGAETGIAAVLVPTASLRAVLPMGGTGGGAAADEVMMPAGSGLLIRNNVSPGTVYLVSEFGMKFAVPDGDALTALGYAGVPPILVSSELLTLLPTGPVLSRASALAGQPAGG